jgi:hypothetical protein
MSLPTPWLEITVFGFVYIVAFSLFLLSFMYKHEYLKIAQYLKNMREYLPYIGAIILFSSYLVGYSAHLVIDPTISKFYSKNDSYIKALAEIKFCNSPLSDQLQSTYRSVYTEFIMFRHLTSATFCLSLSLWFFYCKTNVKKLKWLIIASFILSLVFLWDYCVQRAIYLESLNDIYNYIKLK